MSDVARVCVTPDDIGIDQDSVRVGFIDSFTWLRDDLNMTQPAITSDAKAEDRPEIFSEAGSIACTFETNLLDGFFYSPGAVQCNGIVWLQFESDSRRSLAVSFQLKERNLLRQRRCHLQHGLEDHDLGAQNHCLQLLISRCLPTTYPNPRVVLGGKVTLHFRAAREFL